MRAINRSRRILTHTVAINASRESVFPLLCPVREYEWIPDWKCELIYSESGLIETDCIFTTEFKGLGKETWHVCDYTPNEHICFIRISHDLSIRFDINLIGTSDKSTDMTWTQSLTSLSERGDEIISGMKPDSFSSSVIVKGRQLEHYIRTGSILY